MEENQTIDEELKDAQGEAEEAKAADEAAKENVEAEAEVVDASEETSDETSEPDESEKKGFFKKDKKDKKDEKIEELTDQYRRTLAEFDNYRKRTDKEKASMFDMGAKNIIEKLLPVVDSFERGLATVPEEEKNSPFAEGMDKIYKQLVKQLEDAGVKEIEALNKEFDPNIHNAVMHVEDDSVGEQIVVEVFQKGYTYKDSVVRCSMVKVAN